MNTNLKLKISVEAYKKLLNLLNQHKTEYSCIRFNNTKSCCNNVKVDIMLDTINENDIVNNFQDLKIVYNKSLLDYVNEIELIYKNSSLMMKITPIHVKKQCNKSHSTNKSCSSCSGCSNLKNKKD